MMKNTLWMTVFLLFFFASNQGRGADLDSVKIKSLVRKDGGSQHTVVNLFEVKSGGWVAFGDGVTTNTIEKVDMRYTMLMEKFPEAPFPPSETLRVTFARELYFGEQKTCPFHSEDDVYEVRVQYPGVYVIATEGGWVKLRGIRQEPVPGLVNLYLCKAYPGDLIRFVSKSWTPKVFRLEYEGMEKKPDSFPIEGTTTTEHDYAGVMRVLAGERDRLYFQFHKKNTAVLNPSEYVLVIEAPQEISSLLAFGYGSKMDPMQTYPITAEDAPYPYRRYIIPMEIYLKQQEAFLAGAPAYPKTDYISSAICVSFLVERKTAGALPPVFWYMRRGGEKSAVRKLTVEAYELLRRAQFPKTVAEAYEFLWGPRFPKTFTVHLGVGRFPSGGPEEVGGGWGQLLRRCGISTVATPTKEVAARMKRAGLETIYMAGYNHAEGGIDVNGKEGRICPNGRITDGGEYYLKRFFDQGRDMKDVFDAYEVDYEPKGAFTYQACFCKNCRKAFSERSGIEADKMPAAEILKKHKDKWVEFRQWQFAEGLKVFADAVRNGIDPRYKLYFCSPVGDVATQAALKLDEEVQGARLEDVNRYMDFNAPMFYCGITHYIDKFKFQNQFCTHARLAPWTAISYGLGLESHTLSPSRLRLEMFMWYAMGAPAFRAWNETETGLDGRCLATIQRTLHELTACERYYANGKPDDEAITITGQQWGGNADCGIWSWKDVVQFRAHRLGQSLAVTLFNLDPDGDGAAARVKVAVQMPDNRSYKVRDLLRNIPVVANAVDAKTLAGGLEVVIGPKDVLILEVY